MNISTKFAEKPDLSGEGVNGIAFEKWIKGCPKQRLLNYLEGLVDKVDFRIYDYQGFYNAEIIFAPEFAIPALINNLPENIHCHINASTEKFELFIDKDL